ncbi:MAG: mannose-phosphate guanylyltransferase / mannose-6-phosphate isomerase [Acidobacteriota bacterium]|nr:mannose-phosphate guanylyltransferase / mannose-6-phosphate isomerase [Acidobacteriota bacterium]
MLEKLAEYIYKHRGDGVRPVLLLGTNSPNPPLTSPSQGHWFLAELIKKGFFDLVLTTSCDNCLEKALVMTMDYDDFKVIARGEVDDARIVDIIGNPHFPKVKIVKLRDESRANNSGIESSEELEIKGTLRENLFGITRERGIIVLGNSAMAHFLLRDFSADENEKCWRFDGDEGGFDNFFISLTKIIGEKEQKNSEVLSRLQKELTKSIDIGHQSSICKVEVDRRRLNALIRELKNGILSRFPTFDNFIFIDDPVAPGGIKILEQFTLNFKSWIDGKRSFKLEVSGRGDEAGDRTAGGLSDENDNDVVESAITEKDRKFLLIDSVSFSGGTIEKAKNKLIQIFGSKIDVKAAVIYTGPDLENKLKEKEFCIKEADFFRIEELNSYQVLFPWGWISTTVPIFTDRERRSRQDIFNEFIPDKHFDLLPRPWGSVFSMVENQNVSVKMLYLNPGEALSLHKHYVRDEIFLVLDEQVQLQIWNKKILLQRGNSFRVPAGTTHRLTGVKVPCRVLEISRNYYNQEEDIERIKDRYGRDRSIG